MNIVDSCGWIEYFTDDVNRKFFEPVLLDADQLLVADLTIYEVCRRLRSLYDETASERAYRLMASMNVVSLDAQGMFDASAAAHAHSLHLADAIIWQTAQKHQAALWTQDAALRGLPGVKFRAKTHG
jgi:predicted nucleic acid-binding protein